MTQPPQTPSIPRRVSRAGALLGSTLAATLLVVPAAQAKTVTVTAAKSGKAIVLKQGDKLVVRLAENPSTGYAWKTLAKPAILKVSSSRYVAPPSSGDGPPVVGAGGTRVLTYVARRTGTGTLKLRYTGPTGADGGRFTLRVTVR
jgi:inhibitor of cysteine peptidase